MDNKKLGYMLLGIGAIPILIALMMVIQGVTKLLFIRLMGDDSVLLQTLVGVGFFMAILTGVYLLKKR